VLYSGGVPAGYTEIDRSDFENVEIKYFGLTPDFIGHGLGWYFLNWAIDKAWDGGSKRVWVHTCDLDHPRALPNYQKAGFVAFDRRPGSVAHPRLVGLEVPQHRR